MTPATLRALREACGLSQRGAARAVGCQPRSWQRYEAGDRPIPPGIAVLLGIWADPRCPDWARPWIHKEAAE